MGPSRKRILAALDHSQTDRVPIDFGSHRSSGCMALAYRRLRDHLELPKRPIRVYDVVQQLAMIDDDVLDRFGIDAVELGRGFCLEERDWKPWELPDGSECLVPAWVDLRRQGADWWLYSSSGRPVGVQKRGSLYFTQAYWPFEHGIPSDLSDLPRVLEETMWAVATPPGPVARDPTALREGARRLRESTDRAIVGLFGGNLLESGQVLCRNDNFYVLLGTESETAERLLDRLVEIHLADLETFLEATGDSIDVVLFGDDLGMQTGPQISPAMYRRLFKPRHQLLWRRAKELAPVKVLLHSCGGIRPLLEDIIEAGADAINPVQTSCAGMDARSLKADFGGRLCLWGGGCDTQSFLSGHSPAAVKSHVHERLEIMAPGGGFVFQQVHNVMADVQPATLVAMFEAVAEFKG
jgi:uroporphyrinogen decarboxylase